MCMITLCPPNVAIPKEGIENGACSNPDGHGWAVASIEHGLVMGKSMSAEEAIKAFIAERERQGATSVALFHSRLGTHGTKNLDNVHPFYVPDPRGTDHNQSTVMAHNGIMPSLWHPMKDDDRSDTRVFADRTAAWYITEHGIPSRRGAKALGEMIGRGNKLVFLSVRAGRPRVRIVNAKSGQWHEGVWYSNDWYKRKRHTTTTTTRPSTAKMCKEKTCTNTFYNQPNETYCWSHRPKAPSGPKALTPPKRPAGYVSPYGTKDEQIDSKPESGGEYVTYPPSEEYLDEETMSILDDIEATLDSVDGVKIEDLAEDRKCEICRKTGQIHIPTNVCLACQSCLDCWVPVDDCTCFDYAGWIAKRTAEQDELAEALAREADEDARSEAERLAAEQAEEQWLAEHAEQVQVLRAFYGMTTEQAERVLAESEPSPPSTNPTASSGR